MKYLENSIKYLIKFYILAVPLLVLYAVSALFRSGGGINSITGMMGMFSNISRPGLLSNPLKLIQLFSSYIPFIIGGGPLVFLLKFAVEPATYGLVNGTFEGQKADLNNFVPSLKQHFVKYVMFFVGSLVVGAVISIAALLILVIFGLLTTVLKGFGVFLLVLVIIALIVAAILIGVLISLWFSAMVVDNLDVVAAVKKSVEIARSAFWTILGIGVLVAVAGGIAASILGVIFGWIPLIGGIILSVIPAAAGFIMTVFYLMIYREKTGRSILA